MSDTLPRTRWQTINATPLRDLLRGRITARLDWPARLAAAGLPADVSARISRVVRRTRLWRLERAAVADELIAHFADAAMAGVSPAHAVRDFGDERAAAKLIRRAKRRGRPLASHAWTWAWRATTVVLAVYVALLLPCALGRPRPSVDYVAQLAAPTRAVPADDRAWPLWRQVVLACTTVDARGRRGDADVMDSKSDAPPDRAGQAAWLTSHADALAIARRAAAMPSLGFVVGPGGSAAADRILCGPGHDSPGEPVCDVRLPYLNWLRPAANWLAADLSRAADQADGGRVEADVVALHRLAGQLRASNGFLVTGEVALGVDERAVRGLAAVVADRPGLLSDGAVVRLAHGVAGPQVAADLFDARGDRVFFDDSVQRMYTDDGHGGGQMTWAGVGQLARFETVTGDLPYPPPDLGATLLPFAVASRAEVVAAYAAFAERSADNLGHPLRLADWKSVQDRLYAWHRSPIDCVRYATLLPFAMMYERPQVWAERYFGQRDGLLVGLALEMYHRRHGRYPATLAELTPDLLPSVPADRITGVPVRYRLVGGRPVVYSVGADRVDDGGRPPAGRGKSPPNPSAAAEWGVSPADAVRGDWVLYPPPQVDADGP